MKISTKTLGRLDYVIALILMSSPWIFDYASSYQYFIWIPFILGSLIMLYSMLTKYESGFYPLIGVKMHIVLDFLSGVFLAASPWLFGFNELIFLPHVFLGVALILLAFVSKRQYNPKNYAEVTAVGSIRDDAQSKTVGKGNPQRMDPGSAR